MTDAKFIGVKENVEVFTLRKDFVSDGGKTVLKITALGVYFVAINGVRVGKDYLAPGWTDYNKTLQEQEYEVTKLLKNGKNSIEITVGGGWYYRRESYRQYSYGQKIATRAEMITSNGTLIFTDESWSAKESYIRFSSIYDGEIQDFSVERKVLSPIIVEYDESRIVNQICEPIRDIKRLAVTKKIYTPCGDIVYDFGQNISGVVEITTPKHFQGEIILRFAEILVDGEFYTDNLREAKCTDVFVVNDEGRYSPEFTYHGFRYLKVTGVDLPAENVVAIVRHTDMRKTGNIYTDNEKFNRLIKNVEWGQRDNFVDIPTDCSQRDERLGWTGDINAFCDTAAYQYDIRKIMRKWLTDLRNGQSDTGEIPHIAPDIWGTKTTAAFWSDAITMIPWRLYRHYGDVSFLADNYEAMKKFVAARERTIKSGLISGGHEFGDWLAADNEPFTDNGFSGRTDLYFITNVFHTVSLKITAEAAKILGKVDEYDDYRIKRENLITEMRKEYFTERGRLCFDTVTAQVLALHFDIVEEKYRNKLAAVLDLNVKKHGYRISTGFIGTPFLLFALADNGYAETAEKVLFNEECPGWMYEINMGATTIWERWNGLLPDGKPNPDGMNSYNHYAYGSVAEFVYRRIAGIEEIQPGFAAIKISPHPFNNLPKFSAEFDSVHGKIISGYEIKKDKIEYFTAIPDGITAEYVLPGEKAVVLGGGKYSFERKRSKV